VRLSPTQRRIVERVVNAFETGRAEGDYAAVSLYDDGPHDIPQIPCGRSETTEFGNLRELVHGLALPLSGLVVYDPFIHSGWVLWVIRESFRETLPADGGGERTWLAAYVRAGDHFLATHRRSVVRRTVYRTRCLLREIERGNWNLELLPIDANGVSIHAAR
jgi:hypothetical protein